MKLSRQTVLNVLTMTVTPLLLLLTCPVNLHAQHGNVRFEHVLNLATHVADFIQDGEGFFWFATTSGLIRYDGLDIKIYKNGPNSVSSDVCNALADTNEALWILTGFQGLNRLDKDSGTFTYYMHDPDDPNSLNDSGGEALHVDSAGVLWVGTREGGLNAFDPDTETFKHYPHNPDDPQSLSDNYVTEIYEDRSGTLWIGTQHGGLNRFVRETERFVRYPSTTDHPNGLSGWAVNVIYEDSSGSLWIGTGDGGLNKLDRKTDIFTHYHHDPENPKSVSLDTITDIYEDPSGTLWIATFTGGLNVFEPETNSFTRYQTAPDTPGSLSSDSPLRIHRDSSDILWIISKDGKIDKYDRKHKEFTLYRHDPAEPASLSDNVVLPIYEDSQDVIWIGTGGGGLNKFNRTTETFTRYQPNPEDLDDPERLPYMTVTCIVEDRLGNFWIDSTNNAEGVLSLFDRDSGRFIKHYRHDPAVSGSIPQNKWLTRVFPDIHHPNILWMTIAKEGLIKFDTEQETFTHYAPDPDNPEALLGFYNSMMHQDDDGTLWLGGVHGLDHFDPRTEKVVHYQHQPDNPASISDNTTLAILEDRSGTLWFGTAGGLNKFDRATETFTYYTTDDGLPDNQIYAIFEDDEHDFWMSTNGGIARFNPKTETFRTYTKSDGLQGDAFYYWAYCQSKNGEIWFGGLNGVNRFRPEAIKDNPHLPNIVLTSVTQGGEDMKLNRSPIRLQEMTLDWRANFFEFAFAALEYTRPEKNQYAYILEGFDRQWYASGTNRRGRYSNLPGGTYTLKMKGSNNDGLWSKQELAVGIIVTPPPWKTWWAYSVYAFISAGMILGYIRFQRKKLERERLMNARLRQIDKLKDEFLANTSHELRTPLTGIMGLTEAMLSGADGPLSEQGQKHAHMILQSSKRLTGLVNSLLDFSTVKSEKLHVHAKSFPLTQVIEVVQGFSQELLKTKAVEITVELPNNLPEIYADMDKTEQILTNLVGNAVKFTREGSVTISAIQEGDFVRIDVRDTGIGIPKDAFDRIFTPFEQVDGSITREFGGTGLGLAITRELVELHGGQIWVESEVGAGSSFHVTLPCSDDSLKTKATSERRGQAREGYVRADTTTPHTPIDDESDAKEEQYARVKRGNGERILIVDDDRTNVEVLRSHLSQYNYDVLIASDGFEALEQISQKVPDLLLLDLMMPKMSGFRLCHILREDRQLRNLPIVMLTARSDLNNKVYGLNIGANDYVVKPFHQNELLTRIHVLLNISALQKKLIRNNELLRAEILLHEEAEEKIRQFNEQLEYRVRQRTLELEDANKDLKDFAYIVSHDLKAPLRNISQLAQWLVADYADAFDEQGREMIALLVGRVNRMDNLINGVLGYSRIGRIVGESEPIDLNQEIPNIVASLALPEHIRVTIENELPIIRGDRIRIIQIFQNLISNAIKFMDKAQGKITISSRDDNDSWEFRIADNGPGIEEKYYDRIFQIFQTLRPRDEHESTGIGLSIVKKIVEFHGGRIWVESTPGEGSIFSFTVPKSRIVSERKGISSLGDATRAE